MGPKKYQYLIDREFDVGCVYFRYTGIKGNRFVDIEQRVSCEPVWKPAWWNVEDADLILSGKTSIKPFDGIYNGKEIE